MAFPSTHPFRRCLAVAALLALAPGAAVAGDTLLTAKVLPLSLATEAAETAIATCAAKGVSVTAVVVDHAGLTKLLLVGDNTGPLGAEMGRRKAYTAGSFNVSTGDLTKQMQSMPDGGRSMQGIDPNILTFPGGAPIRVGKDAIAALGISGAPDPSIDQACADAGVAKIKDRLS